MDGHNKTRLKHPHSLYDSPSLGLTQGARATIEAMSRSRFSPIGSREISIAIDSIDVLAGAFCQAVGVGLREDGYGSFAPDLGVVSEKAAETVGQLGGGGLVAVDAAKDEDGVGARTEDGHDQRFALDGVAESYGADGEVVLAFTSRWDNFYGMRKRLGGPEAAGQGNS